MSQLFSPQIATESLWGVGEVYDLVANLGLKAWNTLLPESTLEELGGACFSSDTSVANESPVTRVAIGYAIRGGSGHVTALTGWAQQTLLSHIWDLSGLDGPMNLEVMLEKEFWEALNRDGKLPEQALDIFNLSEDMEELSRIALTFGLKLHLYVIFNNVLSALGMVLPTGSWDTAQRKGDMDTCRRLQKFQGIASKALGPFLQNHTSGLLSRYSDVERVEVCSAQPIGNSSIYRAVRSFNGSRKELNLDPARFAMYFTDANHKSSTHYYTACQELASLTPKPEDCSIVADFPMILPWELPPPKDELTITASTSQAQEALGKILTRRTKFFGLLWKDSRTSRILKLEPGDQLGQVSLNSSEGTSKLSSIIKAASRYAESKPEHRIVILLHQGTAPEVPMLKTASLPENLLIVPVPTHEDNALALPHGSTNLDFKIVDSEWIVEEKEPADLRLRELAYLQEATGIAPELWKFTDQGPETLPLVRIPFLIAAALYRGKGIRPNFLPFEIGSEEMLQLLQQSTGMALQNQGEFIIENLTSDSEIHKVMLGSQADVEASLRLVEECAISLLKQKDAGEKPKAPHFIGVYCGRNLDLLEKVATLGAGYCDQDIFILPLGYQSAKQIAIFDSLVHQTYERIGGSQKKEAECTYQDDTGVLIWSTAVKKLPDKMEIGNIPSSEEGYGMPSETHLSFGERYEALPLWEGGNYLNLKSFLESRSKQERVGLTCAQTIKEDLRWIQKRREAIS